MSEEWAVDFTSGKTVHEAASLFQLQLSARGCFLYGEDMEVDKWRKSLFWGYFFTFSLH